MWEICEVVHRKIAGTTKDILESLSPLLRLRRREFIIEIRTIAYPQSDKTWIAISIDIAAADLSISLAAGSLRE